MVGVRGKERSTSKVSCLAGSRLTLQSYMVSPNSYLTTGDVCDFFLVSYWFPYGLGCIFKNPPDQNPKICNVNGSVECLPRCCGGHSRRLFPPNLPNIGSWHRKETLMFEPRSQPKKEHMSCYTHPFSFNCSHCFSRSIILSFVTVG